jgi:hypothetical protein
LDRTIQPARDVSTDGGLPLSLVDAASSLTNNAYLFDTLIMAIRATVAPGVSSEARASGAAACRAILNTFEAQGGPFIPAPASLMSSSSPLLRVLSHLVSMSHESIQDALSNKPTVEQPI